MHLSGQTRRHITWSSMHWLIFFLKTRYNLCIWTNRDRENFYNGRGQVSSWTTWNNPKLICTYIWTYCQSSWWHKVGQILKRWNCLIHTFLSFLILAFQLIQTITVLSRFLVRVSYLEIYNENVRDLLGKDQSAKLEASCGSGFFLKNLWGQKT